MSSGTVPVGRLGDDAGAASPQLAARSLGMRHRGNASGSGRKRARTGVDAIKLVGVIEQSTGILLFQHVYRWAEEANPKALGSLARSFFQFSRDIDDGSIGCVNFEKPAQTGGHHRRQASNHLRWKMRTAVETMQLLCAGDAESTFTVLLFHEVPGGAPLDARQDTAVRDFLARVRDAFEEDFRERLEAMTPRIRSVYETPGGPTEAMVSDIQAEYIEFETAVQNARASAFQQAPRAGKESMSSVPSVASSTGDTAAMQAVIEERKRD